MSPSRYGQHHASAGVTRRRFGRPVDVVYLEGQAGSIYAEEAGETERYSQMFSHLIAKALSPEDSVRLIRELARSF